MQNRANLAISIVFLPIFVGQLRAADTHSSVIAIPATKQAGPVHITQARSTSENIFDSVTVINTTDRIITALTFGTVYRPVSLNPSLTPIVIRGESISKAINPNERVRLDLAMEPPKAALERTKAWSSNVVAELGVVEVLFADGGRFSFDPEPENGFSPKGIAPVAYLGSKSCSGTKSAAVSARLQKVGFQRGGIHPDGAFSCEQRHLACIAASPMAARRALCPSVRAAAVAEEAARRAIAPSRSVSTLNRSGLPPAG